MKTLILGVALLFPQPEVQTTVIRSIKYENFKGISLDEMMQRLKDRGVRVAVEQFYEPPQIEKATAVLQEFVEEKGRRDLQVKSVVRQLPPRSVEVKFTAVHN